ncbi:porin family protein [Sediminitomix flava]|uniref:Outer membrane protein with beta-barrel domain n=1 Tax=Sediminitomix flava TaxID=379075 RepID=A0A315Z7P0_SEDFL|nr:outer membrane beta-barrel protein [Sediminitomix flava]PWJ38621.1 outer membrane protein with beta-barrel domain [Sediminitomix flava]
MRIYILFFVFLFFQNLYSFAQDAQLGTGRLSFYSDNVLGFKLGLNHSSIKSDTYQFEDITGFHLGGYLNARFNKDMAFLLELMYSLEGGSYQGNTIFHKKIALPLLLKIYFLETVNMQLGPAIELPLPNQEIGISSNLNEAENLTPTVGLSLGLGVDIKEYNLTLRYNVGTSQYYESIDGDLGSKVLQLSIGKNFD